MEKITPMSKTLLAVLTLYLLFVPLAAAGEPPNLRVLSYNIHHGEGVDHKLDLKRIARVIKSVSPDVVALQEVDRGTERTDRVDQPAELARLTNMKVLFERNIDHQGGQYGNAILSKLPITRHENVHLPLLDDGEQRGLLIAELKWQSQEILFLCTHLDFRADDRERLASAKRINNLIDKRASKPAILAGDLNATRRPKNIHRKVGHHQRPGITDRPGLQAETPNRFRTHIKFHVVEGDRSSSFR